MQEQVSGYKLSPQQRRLWSLSQEGLTAYAQCAVRLEGALDIEMLREAVRSVVARHEILRTTFRRPLGVKMPVQVIEDEAVPLLEISDLSGFREAEQRERFDEISRGQRLTSFDLAGDSPLRASLVVFSAREHLLLLTLPALCADARTLHNLVDELSLSYAANADHTGKEPLQYAQFSAWQDELLAEDDRTGVEFWRGRCAKSRTALSLPLEARSSDRDEFAFDVCEVKLEPEIASHVRSAAEELGATSEEFLLACWHELLHRHTGQSDITIGVAFDGRTYEELGGAMGHLSRWLPVSTSLGNDTSFERLLGQVRDSTREARTWEEYYNCDAPGDDVQRAPVRQPLFAFGFEYAENNLRRTVNGVDFSIESWHTLSEPFKVKLCCAAGDSLRVELLYNSTLLPYEDARQLGVQLRILLHSASREPRRAIGLLDLLVEEERRRAIHDWNDTHTDFTPDLCVHQLFEAQAAISPDATAVVFGEEHLTYRELNLRAEQLAQRLRRYGVAPEVRVGLLLDRGLDEVVAVLAVLKAGGVYVPLDLQHPYQRLSFMLADSGAAVLVTQRSLAGSVATGAARVIYCDDDVDDQESSDGNELAGAAASLQNLAYVIYTSGSTGAPKGVMVTHRGLVNYVQWCLRAYGVAEGARAPLHSSLGFDLTVTSLFPPLLTGGRIEVMPADELLEPLAEVLRRGVNYSLIKLTPAHLDALAQRLGSTSDAEIVGARAFIVGGEALRGESLSYWMKTAPMTRLFNEYGPTETVVGCCVYEAASGDELRAVVPIGRPIANTQAYVLDTRLLPSATGIAGELYVGGAGVARGYLNRPELTAEYFVPDPFSTESGARLYKTGDLAFRRTDGNLEFIGRSDQQVKLRGYRIELGEIESVLLRHPAVRECAVVLRDGPSGESGLVAYVAGNAVAVTPAELRPFLLTQLPEHMVPAVFVRLEALPLTPNGKVDRRALPEPDASDAMVRSDDFRAPRTDVEQVVAKVWAEVLGIDDISLDDNFFDLGGHSLLVLQVTARLQDIFDIEVPPVTAFQLATVEQLSAWLIAYQDRPGQVEKIAAVVNHVENMSEEDTTRMLAQYAGD
jgi:amino acid adenylation domain-containing protein